jgi:alpha-tubulin suppressor-like RCC1 family protein
VSRLRLVRVTRAGPGRFSSWTRCAWLLPVVAAAACGDGTSPGDAPPPLRFTALSAAQHATCGVTPEGALYCWGDGTTGLAGAEPLPNQCTVPGRSPANVPCSTRPRRVPAGQTFVSLSTASDAFGQYACALDTSGLPYCWGWMTINSDEIHNFGPVPMALPAAPPLLTLSTGVTHLCGITPQHDAICWGNFEGGVRGDPTIGFDTSYATFDPNVVAGGLSFTAIAAGRATTCGLTDSGQTYCWGADAEGQLGDPAAPVQPNCGLSERPCATAPVPVAGGHTFTALSGASAHVCGRDTSGALYCWGQNDAHQIGTAEASTVCGQILCVKQPALVFAQATSTGTFASVSAGGSSTCGLDPTGAAYCWGSNDSGQIGNGGGPAEVPMAVLGELRFGSISVASDHVCALTLEGSAYCWGDNSYGQLGTGMPDDANTPVAVAGPTSD